MARIEGLIFSKGLSPEFDSDSQAEKKSQRGVSEEVPGPPVPPKASPFCRSQPRQPGHHVVRDVTEIIDGDQSKASHVHGLEDLTSLKCSSQTLILQAQCTSRKSNALHALLQKQKS